MIQTESTTGARVCWIDRSICYLRRSDSRRGQDRPSANRLKRLERMKKVGAQRPTKIPKRSACAFDSGSVPPVRNQTAIDAMIEAKPRMKQVLLRSECCLFSIGEGYAASGCPVQKCVFRSLDGRPAMLIPALFHPGRARTFAPLSKKQLHRLRDRSEASPCACARRWSRRASVHLLWYR